MFEQNPEKTNDEVTGPPCPKELPNSKQSSEPKEDGENEWHALLKTIPEGIAGDPNT